MSAETREQLRATWRRLSQRNSWGLVSDEEYFLDQAAGVFEGLSADQSPARRIQVAIQHAYSTVLYEELQWRNDVAAGELWLACYRLALRDERTRAAAEDLAQEAMLHVLEKLADLRSPAGLLGWALAILDDRKRRLLKQQARTADMDEASGWELPDPASMTGQVEDVLQLKEFDALLRAYLPNELQRVVIIRTVQLNERLVEVAAALDVPAARVRLALSRARQRLRESPAALQQLQELLGSELPGGDEDGA